MNINEIKYGITRDPFSGKIYEGLIYTVGIDKTIDILSKNLGNIPSFQIKKVSDVIAIGFNVKYFSSPESKLYSSDIVDPNIQRIIELSNNLGYFIASYVLIREDFRRVKYTYNPKSFKENYLSVKPISVVFTLEKKYDDVVTNVPRYLYHISNKKFLNKVKDRGLVPRSGNKQSYHPERIYFTTKMKDMEEFSDLVSNFIPKAEQLILTVDTKNLNQTFYRDPNLDTAIYCYHNIDPKDIVEYK